MPVLFVQTSVGFALACCWCWFPVCHSMYNVRYFLQKKDDVQCFSRALVSKDVYRQVCVWEYAQKSSMKNICQSFRWLCLIGSSWHCFIFRDCPTEKKMTVKLQFLSPPMLKSCNPEHFQFREDVRFFFTLSVVVFLCVCEKKRLALVKPFQCWLPCDAGYNHCSNHLNELAGCTTCSVISPNILWPYPYIGGGKFPRVAIWVA